MQAVEPFSVPETAHWDHYVQACPECEDGRLEPERESLEDPESAVVVCNRCDTEFRLAPIPRRRSNTHECPECGGGLEMAEIHYSRCVDCGAEWGLRVVEAAWLEPHEGD